MSHEILSFFSTLIEKETGIIFRDINLYQLESRLMDIVKNEKFASLDEFYKTFKSFPNSSLKQLVIDTATNNETLFFRDPPFFTAIEDYLKNYVLPTNPSEIRIWSAASSTGQEAISVAITLEEMALKMKLPPYRIIGSDICEKALERARTGVYTDFEVMRGLTDEKKSRYFNQTSQGWQVKSSIHQKLKFSYNNLTRSTVMGPFHLILCRNVLIYQTVECKKSVVHSLMAQLHETGGLMLGVGETLLGITDNIDPLMIEKVAFYKSKKIAA